MKRVIRLTIAMLAASFLVLAPHPALMTPTSAQNAASPANGDAVAKAYVLVDADTGNIISAHNERAALPPASITKLLTALTVLARMDPQDEITIGTTKPESMPALKVGVRMGETWTVDRLLRGLLMVSANDAAVALAEGSTGSLDAFRTARAEAAADLGLADNPVFNDPAGLDDAEWGYNGGDQVSARDMAIVARASLANEQIMAIVSSQRYEFTGLDGLPHHFLNHNGMLKTYSGAVGMKTGYTRKAGRTLVAAAKRDGRTMIAVLLDSPNTNLFAAQLLDQGFATPTTQQSTAGQLPISAVKKTEASLTGGAIANADLVATELSATQRNFDWETVFLASAFSAALLALIVVHFREPLVRRYGSSRYEVQRTSR